MARRRDAAGIGASGLRGAARRTAKSSGVSAPASTIPPALQTRNIVRIVLTVVLVALALYLIYVLRRPLTWIFIAGVLAIALSGPVNFAERHMRRGFAVALTYLGLILVPVLVVAALVPPIVTEGNNLATSLPGYVDDLSTTVQKNDTLRKLEEDYDIT